MLAGLEAVLRAAPRPSTAGPQPHARAGGVARHPGPEVQEAVEARGAAAGQDCRRWWVWRGQRRRPGGAYFMPLRSTWLAAMSMTLMMKAMAKAQIRLLRTHVWRICWLEQAVATRQEHQRETEGDSGAMPSGAAGIAPRGLVPCAQGHEAGAGQEPQPPCKRPVPPLLSQLAPARGGGGWGVPGVSHSLSTSTGHSAVPRWLSSSVMMMFSMSFMDRCSQKVS